MLAYVFEYLPKMKFTFGLVLFAVTMFGGVFMIRENQFDDQKMACIKAGGRGSVQHTELGIPAGYECMRMHLVLKYRNGEYR